MKDLPAPCGCHRQTGRDHLHGHEGLRCGASVAACWWRTITRTPLPLTALPIKILAELADLVVDVPMATKNCGRIFADLIVAGKLTLSSVLKHAATADIEPPPEGEDTMLVDGGDALKADPGNPGPGDRRQGGRRVAFCRQEIHIRADSQDGPQRRGRGSAPEGVWPVDPQVGPRID